MPIRTAGLGRKACATIPAPSRSLPLGETADPALLHWRPMESKPLELGLLRSFSPLDGLKSENLHSLARKTLLRELTDGPPAVQGRRHRQAHVLPRQRRHRTAAGRSHRAGRSAAARPKRAIRWRPSTPRRYSARVVSDRIEYVSIDSDMLDMMLTWDQTGSYEVNELKGVNEDRRRQRRLDDDAAADQGVPPDSAGEHPGDLHAHAARRLQARRNRSSSRATKAITSTSSSRASAWSRARRRSTRTASSSPSSAWATRSARKR